MKTLKTTSNIYQPNWKVQIDWSEIQKDKNVSNCSYSTCHCLANSRLIPIPDTLKHTTISIKVKQEYKAQSIKGFWQKYHKTVKDVVVMHVQWQKIICHFLFKADSTSNNKSTWFKIPPFEEPFSSLEFTYANHFHDMIHLWEVKILRLLWF